MTQEEKDLLNKDLCARLAHFGLFLDCGGQKFNMISIGFGRVTLVKPLMSMTSGSPLIEEVRPYLRPMSSITEEEREEFHMVGGVMSYNLQNDTWAISAFTPEAYDWLNKNMFDYRGLIEKGLALEAPKDMYKYDRY